MSCELVKILEAKNSIFLPLDSRKWAPDVYDSHEEYIVMEDLNMSGYFTMPFGSKFEFVHMEATMKTLAKMHASSIAFEIAENLSIENNYGHILRELLVDPENPFFVTGLKVKILNLLVEILK